MMNKAAQAVRRPSRPSARSAARISVCKSAKNQPSKLSSELPGALASQRVSAGVASCLAALLLSSPVNAVGLESMDILPQNIDTPETLAQMSVRSKAKLDAAEETFQQSETLKKLLAQSEANKAKNKKEIENKYCYRQAELGVGDCGGLRFIPGMTENGKQKTPDWLANMLGVENPPPEQQNQKTLKDLFKGQPGFESE